MINGHKQLIEDYLPIEQIGIEASREKSVRRGHIATLHLWWARRPLVACRATVYGSLVPMSRFIPDAVEDEKRKSLGRANAAKFVERLCNYPGSPKVIEEARSHILESHAVRLTNETGQEVTADQILAGRVPRPKLLDMFAGGGSIPLEALRLGCEVYALDLNPVAHIIQLCTLVYPQKFGKPNVSYRGMTGPQSASGMPTWGGLAKEVRYWGERVLKQLRMEVGDLYPLIADPDHKTTKLPTQSTWLAQDAAEPIPAGYLMPVGYLWTRTVRCKNPHCGATVPLVKQTWLCRKAGRYVALRLIASKGANRVRFEVIESSSEAGLGFNPSDLSKAGTAVCSFCSAATDSDYVKAEGCAGRMGAQLMAVVCTRPGKKGKVYLSADEMQTFVPDEEAIKSRIESLCKATGLTVPNEPIIDDAKNSFWVRLYGITKWGQLFSPRQQLTQLTLCYLARQMRDELLHTGHSEEIITALQTYLGVMVSKLADFNSTECTWNYTGGRGIGHGFTRQVVPMAWDYAETNPFNPDGASWVAIVDDTPATIESLLAFDSSPAAVIRGDATKLPYEDAFLDTIITDPPYYDNVSYADLSDFFYVWMKRSFGDRHPQHFAGAGSPKKAEAVADPSRHDGSEEEARRSYEDMMQAAFAEAHRVLKPGGSLITVYAHKTTLGWSTLVDALRRAGFVISEAWPLDTERKGRMIAMGTAALASSIFLVARKRDDVLAAANYEQDVRPDLDRIVRERVRTLWDMGISGADLVIACVGAGLKAFTRFPRVEYANGDEVPAQKFLTEVETVVLDTILSRLSIASGAGGDKYSLSGLDSATRFYILWRYAYRSAELESGEAIIFANGTHVELGGLNGLSSGSRPLLAKKKGKYLLLDYATRGEDARLGLPSEAVQAAPLIDALQRTLWLMEHRPSLISEFLREARPNLEQMRLVAQALLGPALKGGELGDVSPTGELGALAKLTANWKSVVEDANEAPLFRAARRGQE